jgi:nitrile hydratase alpha subunit
MGHGHDHDHGEYDPHEDKTPDDPQPRTRAIQSLLVEKGLVSTAAVDEVVRAYEEEIGPLNGARIVARAWTDPAFKERLLDDANEALTEFDFEVGLQHLEVVENTDRTHNVVVCTLCSCYPWSLLGLPPTWYKSPAYRSRIVREPKAVLREFDTDLDEDVDVEVWDSSSEVRYMVLPKRPEGTEGMDREALAKLVTRNAMVGVEEVPSPA